MSDAETPNRRVTHAKLKVNRELFLEALRAKGCARDEDRARLLGMPRRSVNRYLNNEVAPLLPTARWIASQLDVRVDDLWPVRDDRAAA